MDDLKSGKILALLGLELRNLDRSTRSQFLYHRETFRQETYNLDKVDADYQNCLN
jgi:hypothetical protein